jgi:hypothetical protein
MGFLGIIAGLFKPAVDLIDSLHTSEAERLEVRGKLMLIQAQVLAQVADFESGLIEAQAKIIVAEAKSQSWIARNWRPITMLTFLVLIVCDAFGVLAFRLREEAWLLLQLGLSSYVCGRSLEKIAGSEIFRNFKKKPNG